jgi:hypothetical protein
MYFREAPFCQKCQNRCTLMNKYAGIEFANVSSQWKARTLLTNRKQKDIDQKHAVSLVKGSGDSINRKKHKILKPAVTFI